MSSLVARNREPVFLLSSNYIQKHNRFVLAPVCASILVQQPGEQPGLSDFFSGSEVSRPWAEADTR